MNLNYVIVLIIVAVIAYGVQFVLGMQQLKSFNMAFRELKQQGKVAIGTRSGKLRAGTIVMFAIDDSGVIRDGRYMQGVTVLARFKPNKAFNGEDLLCLDHYHPIFRQQNKLIQEAILKARETYIQVETGQYIETQPLSPFSYIGSEIKQLFRRGVKKWNI